MSPERITGLAACWLQVPIVIVSILNSDRIGFKLHHVIASGDRSCGHFAIVSLNNSVGISYICSNLNLFRQNS